MRPLEGESRIESFLHGAFIMVETPIAKRQALQRETARRYTILIVEDDESQLLVLSRRLENFGFNIAVASTGQQALDSVFQNLPDLVVMDMQLPDIDGLAVAEMLADGNETCNIPIIMLTGAERSDIVRRARTAGCRYFLSKPYDPNTLLLLIENSLYREGEEELYGA
jgi:CheY-like chemotaxis protein